MLTQDFRVPDASMYFKYFSQKRFQFLGIHNQGVLGGFLICRQNIGLGVSLTWGNSSPATFALRDLWPLIQTVYSWVSLSGKPHLAAERIMQGNRCENTWTENQHDPHPHAQGGGKKTSGGKVSFPLYRWRNWGPKRQNDLSRVPQVAFMGTRTRHPIRSQHMPLFAPSQHTHINPD